MLLRMPGYAFMSLCIPRQPRRVAYWVQRVCGWFYLILILSGWCYSSDVVLLRSTQFSAKEQHGLELATQFYGLNLRVITIKTRGDGTAATRAVQQYASLAVAVDSNALSFVTQKQLLKALHRKSGLSVPLLVLGITADTASSALKKWSGGAVIGCSRLQSSHKLAYVFGHATDVTKQLSDVEIPFTNTNFSYLFLSRGAGTQQLIGIQDEQKSVPFFIKVSLPQANVFFVANRTALHDGVTERSDDVVSAFAQIAPEMMFIKYSAGERGWHAVHPYANLTIDDPWLREPYGHLSYRGLLKEMEKHNFYTTIAFIPWNYDRSQPEVVSLFRMHPERFSICIHGDNHDHKEFDDLTSKPLNVQVAALKQSLARMHKFQSLTGITYDNVFVFPHSIGSDRILEQLKTYNVLGTVNSLNVPMDGLRPPSLLFALRPITVSFAEFPSILRYPVGTRFPEGFLAINEFLGNPLFFYGHQDLFASGMNAFDAVADEVNKIEPDTRWRSVGDIFQHLYLLKLRGDGNYDVLSFASTIHLDNTSERDAVFHVKKQEPNSAAIASVTVDGRNYPFQTQGQNVELSVSVPSGKSRTAVVQYKNDLDLASVSLSKSSLRVYLLRKASDFRDITLSRYGFGSALTEFYYKHELTPMLVILWGCGLTLFSIGVALGLRAIIKGKIPFTRRWNILARESAVATRTK